MACRQRTAHIPQAAAMGHLAFSQTLTLAQMSCKMQAEACCCPSCRLCRRGRPDSKQVTALAEQGSCPSHLSGLPHVVLLSAAGLHASPAGGVFPPLPPPTGLLRPDGGRQDFSAPQQASTSPSGYQPPPGSMSAGSQSGPPQQAAALQVCTLVLCAPCSPFCLADCMPQACQACYAGKTFNELDAE